MSYTLADIHHWLEQRTGHALNQDEGISFGDLHREIAGISVCWMPSPENIRCAARQGSQLLIHHEALLFPYPFEHHIDLPALSWATNRRRLVALAETGLVSTRLHGTLDEIYIYQAFAEQLGLRKVVAQGDDYAARVFEIDPIPYDDLIRRVKEVTGLDAVRATRVQPDRVVRYVGMPWGGMGLFVNVGYMQSLMELFGRIDVMIAGETDNYGFRFVAELGIDMIETSHELSENKGLEQFTQAIQAAFPGLTTHFIEERCAWMPC